MQKKTFSLLKRNAAFRRFLGAVSVSLLGTQIFDFAVPLYVLERTNSAIALSFAAVALHLPFFVMAPFVGYAVDNFNKRKVMLNSDICQVVLLVLLFAYDFLPTEFSLWPLLLTVFVAKTFMMTFETVATFQLIPALVGKNDLNDANTWFLTSQRVIQVVAPLAAGPLMQLFGFRVCILLNLASFAATLYFVLRMNNLNELIEADMEMRRTKKKPTIGNVVDSFIDSVKYVWKSPIFKPFILMMFIWNASPLIPATPSIIYYFRKTQEFTESQYAFVAGFIAVVGTFGFLAAGYIYERFRFYRSFAYSGLFMAMTGTVSLLFYNHPIGFAFIFAFSKIGASVLSWGTFSLRQTNIPRSMMGGVNACLRMFFMSSMPLAALIQGPMIKHFGTLPTLMAGAVCLWGTAWYALRVSMAVERTEVSAQKKVA